MENRGLAPGDKVWSGIRSFGACWDDIRPVGLGVGPTLHHCADAFLLVKLLRAPFLETTASLN